MKQKFFRRLIPVLFFASITCAVLLPQRAAAQTAVIFPDPNLESQVLIALGSTNRPVTTIEMLNLTNLLVWLPVTNLDGLQFASNLTTLRVVGLQLTTLSPLHILPRLTNLDFQFCDPVPSDISVLTGLAQLGLYHSRLTNAIVIAGLTNLAELDLGATRCQNPELLVSLPRLAYLDYSENELHDAAPLSALTNLTGILFLDSNGLTNVAALAGLTNLTELSLYDSPAPELAPLAALKDLRTLDLAYVPVGELSPLTALTNLRTLFLEGTALTNVSRLPGLPSLQSLDINYNALLSLQGLERFTNLTWLNTSFNFLTNIDVLTNLPALQTGHLEFNLLNTNNGSPAMQIVQALTMRGQHISYYPQHSPPWISLPASIVIPADEISSIRFSVNDDTTDGSRLSLRFSCSNSNLLQAQIGSARLADWPDLNPSWYSSTILWPFVTNAPELTSWSGVLNLLPGVGEAGAATVTIIVDDSAGSTTSHDLEVTVLNSAALSGVPPAVSDTNLAWRTFGQSPWQLQTSISHEGAASFQSGSTESWLQTGVSGPGLFSFWWFFTNESQITWPTFTAICPPRGLLGQVSPSPSETNQWQQVRVSIPEGNWMFRWQMSPVFADPSAAWLSGVHWEPGPAPCWLQIYHFGDDTSGLVLLNGAPGETYDLERLTNFFDWSLWHRFTLLDFQDRFYPVVQGFYRMRTATLAPLWLESPRRFAGDVTELVLHSEPNQPVQIECSTNLQTWTSLAQTNIVEGTLHVTDNSSNSDRKFYRVKAMPWGRGGMPGQAPTSSYNRRHRPPGPPVPRFPDSAYACNGANEGHAGG